MSMSEASWKRRWTKLTHIACFRILGAHSRQSSLTYPPRHCSGGAAGWVCGRRAHTEKRRDSGGGAEQIGSVGQGETKGACMMADGGEWETVQKKKGRDKGGSGQRQQQGQPVEERRRRRPSGKGGQQGRARGARAARGEPAEDLESLEAAVEVARAGTGEVAKALEESKFRPGAPAYTTLIKACSESMQLDKALEVLKHMESAGVEANTITYSAAITACGRCKQAGKALELYEEMKSKGVSPNIYTFSALISACARGRQASKAAELFDEMKRERVEPDSITYSAMISACEKGRQPAKALEVFDEMRQRGMPANAITYNSLIAACEHGTQENLERAISLLPAMREDGAKPDHNTFGHLLSACEKGSLGQDAVRLVSEAENEGIELESSAYANTVDACSKEGCLERALPILRSLAERPLSLDAVLPAFCRVLYAAMRLNTSEEELVDLASAHFLPRAPADDRSSEAFAAALHLCHRLAKWECAIDLCGRAEELKLDNASPELHVSTLGACAAAGRAEKAADIFERALHRHSQADLSSAFDHLLSACTSAGQPSRVESFISRLPRSALSPSSTRQLLSLAPDHMQEGEDSSAPPSSSSSLVSALPTLFDRLSELEERPPASACRPLAESLLKHNRPADAARCVIAATEEQPGDASFLPERGTLDRIRRACVQSGASSLASSLASSMRSCGVEPAESLEAQGISPPTANGSAHPPPASPSQGVGRKPTSKLSANAKAFTPRRDGQAKSQAPKASS